VDFEVIPEFLPQDAKTKASEIIAKMTFPIVSPQVKYIAKPLRRQLFCEIHYKDYRKSFEFKEHCTFRKYMV